MALQALLFAHHVAAGVEPLAATSVAGLTVLERQARLARRLGADRVYVVAERMPPGLAAAIDRLRGEIELIRSPLALATTIEDDDRLLTFEEGLVVDDAAVAPLLESAPDTMIAVKLGDPPYAGAERLDSASFWAGVAIYEARLVRDVVANLGEWDLQSTLLRSAAGEGVPPVDAFATPPSIWTLVTEPADAVSVAATLLDAGREVRATAPARYLYEPVERRLVEAALPTRLPGMAVIIAGVGAGAAAIAAFAIGWLWVGLLLALIAPPLADTGCWLVRARLGTPPDWVDGALDRVVEPAWYLGLAAGLAGGALGLGAWAVAVAGITFRLASDMQRRFFARLRGTALENAGPAEARLAAWGASRETAAWILLPFAVADAWALGFAALALHAGGSFFLWQARLFARLENEAGNSL